MPKQIKIGGIYYNCAESNDLTRDLNALGTSCGNKSSIRVDSTINEQLKRQTLIHEIVEQVNFLYELDLPHNTISTLDAALYQILQDNPDVVSYITEKTGRDID